MAQRNFLVDLNLNNNQLLNTSLQVLSSHPSTPSLGQIYYNSANGIAWVYDGSSWASSTVPTGIYSNLTTGTNLIKSSWSAKDLSDWANAKYATSSHTHTFASLTSKPTTLSGFGITDAYTKTQIDARLTSVYTNKGSVANYASLPSTGQQEGDVWNLLDTGDNYVWVGDLNNTGLPGWDKLASTIDLNGYVPSTRTITINGTSYDLSANRSFTTPNTTYSAGDGLTLTGTSFGLPITTTGTGTYVKGITQLTGGIQIELGTPPNTNTTYTAGTGLTLSGTTFSPTFGTAAGTVAQGNDARFHNAVTIGTANGLSLSTQVLSLGLATTSTAGAMSAADKVKLDDLVGGANSYTALFGAVGTLSYNITHNLGEKFVNVQTFEETTGKQVEMEVTLLSATQVTIAMNIAPTAINQYRIKIVK